MSAENQQVEDDWNWSFPLRVRWRLSRPQMWWFGRKMDRGHRHPCRCVVSRYRHRPVVTCIDHVIEKFDQHLSVAKSTPVIAGCTVDELAQVPDRRSCAVCDRGPHRYSTVDPEHDWDGVACVNMLLPEIEATKAELERWKVKYNTLFDVDLTNARAQIARVRALIHGNDLAEFTGLQIETALEARVWRKI